ncbi:MAG TPA: PfkB family carbohydrate kinase, partial [Candidatus Polarisedimenticolaceae bacterium]|nr:PfkB family carbohydrate kinase [Candidatus Polarisedimenticolaceae bacterium]
TLARLGRTAAFAGVVGDDAAGRMIADGLRRERVGVDGLVRRAGFRSPVSVILVENGRRAIIEHAQYGLPLAFDELERAGVGFDDCRTLLIDARLVAVQLEAARRVRRAGGHVVLDCGHPRPGVDELLSLTDVAIFSYTYAEAMLGASYDARVFLEAVAGRLPPDGPRIAGLTLGPAGCAIYAPQSGFARIGGHAVDAVDPTGAGDVFHGAFVHAHLAGRAPEQAARFANAAAALKCTAMTGRAVLPDEQAIWQLALGR